MITRRSGARMLLRLLPGVTAVLATVVVLARYDVSWVKTAAYLVIAAGWSLLVPGCLVARATLGRARDLPTELFLAFAVGLVVQLPVWAVCVGVGVAPGVALAIVPALVIGVFAAHPRWRAHLRWPAYERATPVLIGWGLDAVYTLSVVTLGVTTFRSAPLPPATGRWYQDLYWHLSISAEATRSVPPMVPQLGTEPLSYHWFANMHMAVGSLVSQLDVLLVTARLWYVPAYAAITLGTYALTVHVSRRPWAGLLAAGLLVVPATLRFSQWLPALVNDAYIPLSPSQIYGLPIMLLAIWLLALAVDGRLTRGGWVLLAVTAVLCAGAKSSILPSLLGGVCLTALAMLLLRRGPAVRRALLTFGILLGALVIGALALAGGKNGSKPGLLTTERVLTVTRTLLPGTDPPHLNLVLILLLVALLLQYAWALPTLALLDREHRTQPAVWLMIGTVLAAQLAMQVIDHASLSQVYFVRGALPLMAVLASWGMAVVFARAHERLTPVHLALAVAAGTVGVLLAYVLVRAFSSDTLPAGRTGRYELAAGALGGTVVVAAALALLLLVRRRPRPAALVALALSAGVLAVATVPAVRAHPLLDERYDGPPVLRQLTPGQVAGTTWLRHHTPSTDLIATNRHCVERRNRPHCDSRAFWVTALSERAAYLESWAYLDEIQARNRVGGYNYTRQPFFDPARQQLNDSAFRAPTRSGLDALYAKGVRWLFADTGAGPVSPELDRLARRVQTFGEVRIYELYPPSTS